MPQHTARERARNKAAKAADAERNRAANAARTREFTRSPFMRGLRSMAEKFEENINLFGRVTDRVKRDAETLENRRR